MTGDDISHRHGFKETQATDEAIAAAMMSITSPLPKVKLFIVP